MLSNRRNQSTFLFRETAAIVPKTIFIASEGFVTENSYLEVLKKSFEGVGEKVKIISVKNILCEDLKEKVEKETEQELREKYTEEIEKIRTGSNPKRTLQCIELYKEKNEDKYDFKNHPDDEFWLILDIDHHLEEDFKDEWEEVLKNGEMKGYKFAISNPFFEVWLLLHHDELKEKDREMSVNLVNRYKSEFKSHYKTRLKEVGAKLKNKKVVYGHYDAKKVKDAIERAKIIDSSEEKYPLTAGSTVYRLVEKIVEISDKLA